jgi:hypothetical protein
MSARTVRGLLVRRDLSGGFFQLVADSGERFTLLGLPQELAALTGAQVEVTGTVDEGGGFGIAMAGPQLRVSKVRKI